MAFEREQDSATKSKSTAAPTKPRAVGPEPHAAKTASLALQQFAPSRQRQAESIEIARHPETQAPAIGQTVVYRVNLPTNGTYRWHLIDKNSGFEQQRGALSQLGRPKNEWAVTWSQAGDYAVICEVLSLPQAREGHPVPFTVTSDVRVSYASSVAHEATMKAVAAAAGSSSFETYHAQREREHAEMTGKAASPFAAEKSDAFDPFIGAMPVNGPVVLEGKSHGQTYVLNYWKGDPASLKWIVIPRSPNPKGQRPIQSAHGAAPTFTFTEPGLYDVVCTKRVTKQSRDGSTGEEFVPVTAMVQAILSANGKAQADELRKNIAHAETLIAKIAKDQETHLSRAVAIAGVHVAASTNKVEQLPLFIGPSAERDEFVVVDLRPGIARSEHVGASPEAALKAFEAFAEKNYPKGSVNLHIAANSEHVTPQHRSFETQSKIHWDHVGEQIGWISAGLVLSGLGLLAAGVTAPVSMIMLGAAAAGTIAGAATLKGHIDEGASAKQYTIDVMQLAAGLAGFRAFGNLAAYAMQVPNVAKSMIAVEFGLNSGSIGLMSTDVAEELVKVNSDASLSEDERDTRRWQIALNMLGQAGFFWLGYRGAKNDFKITNQVRVVRPDELERNAAAPRKHRPDINEVAPTRRRAPRRRGDDNAARWAARPRTYIIGENGANIPVREENGVFIDPEGTTVDPHDVVIPMAGGSHEPKQDPAKAAKPSRWAPSQLEHTVDTMPPGYLRDAGDRAVQQVRAAETQAQRPLLIVLGKDLTYSSIPKINYDGKELLDPTHLTVYVHGYSQTVDLDPTTFGRQIDSRRLANLIRSYGWKKGQPIRLLSCSTGRGENPIAQHLANQLGVEVTAPTEDVKIIGEGKYIDGSFQPVDWITFKPKKAPKAATADSGTSQDDSIARWQNIYEELSLEELKDSAQTLTQRSNIGLKLNQTDNVFEQLKALRLANPRVLVSEAERIIQASTDNMGKVDAAMLLEIDRRLASPEQLPKPGNGDTAAESRRALDDRLLERLLADSPTDKDHFNQTAVAERLATTMGVRLNVANGVPTRYLPDQKLIEMPRGRDELTAGLHEIHHAYNDRRKLVDKHRSLYLGDIRVSRSEELPISGHAADNYALDEYGHLPSVAKIQDAKQSSGRVPGWQYAKFQSLDELSTYPREARNLTGAIIRAHREGRTEDAYQSAWRLLEISGAGVTISEQTKSVILRAQEEIRLALTPGPHQPVKLDLSFGYRKHHGMEMVNGVGREVEYDVLHMQHRTASGRNASDEIVDGRVLIDIPLPVSTPTRLPEDHAVIVEAKKAGLAEYRNRLEELRIACEKTSSLFRDLIPAADQLVQSLELSIEKRTNYALDLLIGSVIGGENQQRAAQAVAKLQDQVTQRAEEVLRITNQLSSLARANNNIPLEEPIQTRPASETPKPGPG